MVGKINEAGFFEVAVEISQDAMEAVADFLIASGSGGVSYDDGPACVVRAYFRPEEIDDIVPALDAYIARLPEFGLDPGLAKVSTRFVPDVDWAHAWREHYHVTHVGERLVIRPVWETYAPQSGEVVIDMDPGMAFGTGEHGTTALCLEALDALIQDGHRVADVGTGSAILAIAAAKLGAVAVDAIDNDREAIDVARRNVAANGVTDQVRVELSDVSALRNLSSSPYDVIVMNIVADVIIPSLPALVEHMHAKTDLLLSGIIDSRQADVEEALVANGLTSLSWEQKGEWRLVRARRR